MIREREAACWIEKREVSMKKQEEIPGRLKSQREISHVQYDPDPRHGGKGKREISHVQYDPEHAMEGKERFLVDGIVRRRPTTPNVIMNLLKTA